VIAPQPGDRGIGIVEGVGRCGEVDDGSDGVGVERRPRRTPSPERLPSSALGDLVVRLCRVLSTERHPRGLVREQAPNRSWLTRRCSWQRNDKKSPDEPRYRTAARVGKVSRTSPRNACASPTRPWCRLGPERNPAASLAVVGPGGWKPGALGSSGLYGQNIRTARVCQEGSAPFFNIDLDLRLHDSSAAAAPLPARRSRRDRSS